jgi:hypothetical protein
VITSPEKRTKTDLDICLRALSDPYRRELLFSLFQLRDQDARDPLTLVETPGDTEQLRAQLHHCHLPKLDDCGFIEWDREAGTVSRGQEWPVLEPLLVSIDANREQVPDGRS